MIAAREFTTAAEIFANAKAVRAKFFGVRPMPKQVVEPTPVAKVTKPVKPKPRVMPMWTKQPMLFDEHIIAYRVKLAVQSLVDCGDMTPETESRRTVHDIVCDVLKAYPDVSLNDIKGPRRGRHIIAARMEAVYAVRMLRPDMSYPAIGRWFGGRDHSTILHSVRKIAAMRGEVV